MQNSDPKPNEEATAEDQQAYGDLSQAARPTLGGLDWPYTHFDLLSPEVERRYGYGQP